MTKNSSTRLRIVSNRVGVSRMKVWRSLHIFGMYTHTTFNMYKRYSLKTTKHVLNFIIGRQNMNIFAEKFYLSELKLQILEINIHGRFKICLKSEKHIFSIAVRRIFGVVLSIMNVLGHS